MTPIAPKLRQLVDWRAAVWAGLISGGVFFLVNIVVAPLILGGNHWAMVRLTASIILGESILPPPATFNAGAFLAALVSNTGLCLLFGLFAAYVIHRGGIVMGFAGNAVMVGSGDATVAQITALAGQLVNMKFSREDEVEADRLGVFFMTDAGFDPNGMVELMEVLEKSGGGARMPEFFSTHPSPDNRIEKIRQAIAEYTPIPEG